MSQTLPDKELAELQRRFKRGYTVERAGTSTNKHMRILDPEGNPVLKPGKSTPILLSSTPGRGVAKGLVHELEVAGVLRTTPRKVERATSRRRAAHTNGSGAQSESRRVALEAMNAGRQEVRREEAERLRNRFVPLADRLGGFDERGLQADLSHVGALIARETGKGTRGGVIFTPDLLVASLSRVKHGQWIEPNYQEVWNDLAARLEAAGAEMVPEFFKLLRRAKGLPETVTGVITKAKLQPGDWPFRVELIDLTRCHVDHSYQRPVDWLWVRKTASTFDATLVGTLDVSEHSHGASFAIMDGQGRTEAMKLVGKTQAYAAIYEGLDTQAEALFFLHKNSNRKAIHPYYTFQAKLTAQDATATAVKSITEQYGYEVSIISASNRNIPEKISAISSLEEAYNRKAEWVTECLSPTLAVLRRSTYGLKEGNSAHLIRSIARIFEMYQDVDEHRLGEVIAERNPTWLLGRMREMGWNQGSQTPALVTVLVEEYNRGLPRGEKLPLPKR
jgi:hypothetical protein